MAKGHVVHAKLSKTGKPSELGNPQPQADGRWRVEFTPLATMKSPSEGREYNFYTVDEFLELIKAAQKLVESDSGWPAGKKGIWADIGIGVIVFTPE